MKKRSHDVITGNSRPAVLALEAFLHYKPDDNYNLARLSLRVYEQNGPFIKASSKRTPSLWWQQVVKSLAYCCFQAESAHSCLTVHSCGPNLPVSLTWRNCIQNGNFRNSLMFYLKEVMFSPLSFCLLVCLYVGLLSAGLFKNYWTDFDKTGRRMGHGQRKNPLNSVADLLVTFFHFHFRACFWH